MCVLAHGNNRSGKIERRENGGGDCLIWEREEKPDLLPQ